MKTLRNTSDAAEIRKRILELTGQDAPRWGVMNVTQMSCHVREAYRFALSSDPVQHIPLPIPPKVAKYVGLRSPLPWPKGVPTLPALKLGGTAMTTTSFDEDWAGLIEVFDRFCAASSLTKDHPFFRSMSHADWMRWGYLHADHHLRQFGR